MVHFIDVVHWWYLEVDHPLSRRRRSGDNYTSKGMWETPDAIQTLLTYPDNELQVYFEGTFSNARNGAMVEFAGSDGTLYLDRGRCRDHSGARPPQARGDRCWVTGSRGQDFYDKPDGELLHLTNWIECVRRSQAGELSGGRRRQSAAAAAHLGNQAFRSGTDVAVWKA